MNFPTSVRKKVLNILAILVAVTLTFWLVACDRNTTSKDSSERPVVIIGSEDYPPFVDMDNNGEPTGLDMDIIREAFDRIGYDISFVEISWEDKDTLLESGEIDCVTGGFTMESREDDYLWVGPYLNSNQVVVVNATSNIHSLQDLEGKTIAVQSASVAESILLNHSNPNIPENIQVCSFENNSLPFAALGCDYVDALVADEPVAVQYMKDYNTVFTILEVPVIHAAIGTAFAKNGDAELCAKVNAAIIGMQEDGTLKEIIKRYLEDTDRYLGGVSLEK